MLKYGGDRLVFSPGYPDFRTYVHEGYMFYKDRLISESIKQFDPITPMNDPDMARVLRGQTESKVGLLPHRVLHGGVELARLYVHEQQSGGIRYFLMDCVDNDDVRCGASIFRQDRVTTGADALAIELAVQWRLEESSFGPSERVQPVRSGGGEAVLIGSCSEITLNQRDHFARSNPVLDIDICEREENQLVIGALAWASQHSSSGCNRLFRGRRPRVGNARPIQFRGDGRGAQGRARPGSNFRGTCRAWVPQVRGFGRRDFGRRR
jgi:uncharacterized protein YgbK (DUF1537 family)